MLTEHTDEYNEGVKPIIEKLYKLRCIECSNKELSMKYKQAKPLLKFVTDILVERNDFLLFRPMWDELHDRMVYYYDYLNKRNLSHKIPLFCDMITSYFRIRY